MTDVATDPICQLAATPLLARRTVLARGMGVVLVAATLFGMMAVLVGVACRNLPATQVAFVRFAGSLLVLLAVTRGRGLRPTPGKVFHILLRGLLGAGSIVLYYHAIRAAGAGFATLLFSVYPVWVALFAATLGGERLDARLVVSLALGVVGVGVVLGPGVELGGATLSGGLAAVAAAVFAGGAVTSARQLRLSETSVLVTTHFMGVGAVVTAPAILRGLPPISPVVFLVLAGVVLTSLGGQLLLHEGLGFVSATEGSLAAATSVAVATGLQAVWLGEQIGRASLLGAGLLFAAVAVAAGRGSARGSALRAGPW